MKRTQAILKYTAGMMCALALASASALAGGDKHNAQMSGNDKTQQSDHLTARAHLKQEMSDAWLDGKLETVLLFNEHLNSFDIDTRVKNGKAYLTGNVESDIERQLAGELARTIDGIDAVQNDLKIEKNAADNAKSSAAYQSKSDWRERVSNATLVAKVKSRLLLNEHTSGLDINVDATDGIVTLSGEVDSAEEADLAEQIAKNVEDTRQVNNRLSVDQSKTS